MCTSIILCPLFGLHCTVLIQSTVYSLTMACNMYLYVKYFGNFLNGLIKLSCVTVKGYPKKNETCINNYACIEFMKANK